MHRSKLCLSFLLAAAVLAICLPLSAATVIQMNLEDMVDRADRIFRGTVLDVREDTVQAGGGELPVVIYRIRVDEAFKGTYEEVKGLQIAEVKMLGKLKPTDSSSPVRRSADILDLPRLEVGADYLLLTTASSAIGLSTTVGLGQGRFEIEGKPGQETVLNGNQNLGLFNGMDNAGFAAGADQPEGGPLPYDAVAALIRNLVGH